MTWNDCYEKKEIRLKNRIKTYKTKNTKLSTLTFNTKFTVFLHKTSTLFLDHNFVHNSTPLRYIFVTCFLYLYYAWLNRCAIYCMLFSCFRSKYKELHDLRGHSLGFSSPKSLSGSVSVLDQLKKLGFDASFFGNHYESSMWTLRLLVTLDF